MPPNSMQRTALRAAADAGRLGGSDKLQMGAGRSFDRVSVLDSVPALLPSPRMGSAPSSPWKKS